MISFRVWLVGLIGAAVIAAAILAASEDQQSIGETNFREAQAAASMQVAMLTQERGLDGYLASGQSGYLDVLYSGKVDLMRSLSAAADLSADSSEETRAVKAQAAAYRAWAALADGAVQRRVGVDDDTVALERARGRIIRSFLTANNTYQGRLRRNRYREEHAAALLPVWLLLGIGTVFVGLGAIVQLRRRRRLSDIDAFVATQARFIEAIQFAQDEQEAHQLLAHHVEKSIHDSSALVLNRNNSADRLEPSSPIVDGHPLARSLLGAEPRTCLAIRLSRRYERAPDDDAEVLSCAICGDLAEPTSCQPLLVGGEVIGSVLVRYDRAITVDDEQRLQETVTRAAPVLANLRNLAIAESRAATDSLTGLPNRRSVDDTLRRLLAQADRAVSPLSIVVLDLDRFKQINDTYGHDRGDDALAALAALLSSQLRASDFAGRSGGEEFVVFLSDTDRLGAIMFAEKVRSGIQGLRIAGVESAITASLGIATFPDDAVTPSALMRAADRALYQAKRNGRDRVETCTTVDDAVPAARA